MSKPKKIIKSGNKKTKSGSSLQVHDSVSLIIPCYNESSRIDYLIKQMTNFDKKWTANYELILVDDGSTDSTYEQLQKGFGDGFSDKASVQILQLPENQGKGAALQAGVAAASGDYLLTLDADMATNPIQLLSWLRQSPGKRFSKDTILIGSREHDAAEVESKGLRRFAGLTFNFIIQLFTKLPFSDTQCGFKLYPAAIGKRLFAKLKNKGWAHDVELLYQAQLEGIPIKDLPVKWAHQAGSKISLVKDSIKMFFASMAISARLKWNWMVVEPLRSLGKPTPAGQEAPLYRLLFVLVAVLLLIMMPLLSFDYGITGDENLQKAYGEKVLAWFETDGENTEALEYKNLYYYGGLFDYTAAWVNKYIGGMDPYAMRHLLNSLVGWLLILFTGLLARELSRSWLVGLLALVFVALSPRIFGHSMNNPKDIPFAAAYVFSMLYMVRFIKALPQPTLRTVFFLTLGIAAAINARVGGILLIAYFGLFGLIKAGLHAPTRQVIFKTPRLWKVAGLSLFVIVAGYFGGLAFWPYARLAPIENTQEALGTMSNFSVGIRMLFEGQHLWSDELPWYYIPKWISIASPLFVLAGLIICVLFFALRAKKIISSAWGMVLFTAVFPVAYAIIKGSSLYDGMRHFLFVYPMLVVLAAYGWSELIRFSDKRPVRIGVAAVLGIMMCLPAYWMVKNHPHQATYFNSLVGGIQGAYGNYETDYWMNAMKGACEWMAENNPELQRGDSIVIHTNAAEPVHYYMKQYAPTAKVRYARYNSRHQKQGDYFINFSRFINTDILKQGLWPAEELVHAETADGVVLAAITKRGENYDFQAYQAEKAQNFAEAARLYEQELSVHPNNEQALMGLVTAALGLNDAAKAQSAVERLLAMSDTEVNHLYTAGNFYLRTNQMDQALNTYQRITDLNYKSSLAYYWQGIIYKQKGQLDQALSTGLEAIKQNPGLKPAYRLVGEVYQAKGDAGNAQRYLNAAQ